MSDNNKSDDNNNQSVTVEGTVHLSRRCSVKRGMPYRYDGPLYELEIQKIINEYILYSTETVAMIL